MKADKGWIDAGQLISWRRLGVTAEVWHRTAMSITPLDTSCPVGSGEVRYFDLTAMKEDKKMFAEIDRIVPSRFRAALPVAKEIILNR